MVNIDINFLIGCTGAAAPEAWRLYNLRTQAVFRWSWGYLVFSIPFILLGGIIAWILEPTSKWAAFYSGLTAPVLLTTAMKDAAKAQKELEDIESKLNKSQLELEDIESKLNESQLEKRQLVEEKQKLQGTVEALRQKVNPQDLEILEAELKLKIEYQDQQNILTSERQNIQAGHGGNYFGRIKGAERPFLSPNPSSGIYFLLTVFIIVIAISLRIIHIFFFVLLGVITLATIIFLLKNLQQNRSFKEFLKGL
jgi:hypothetical protein